MKGILLKVMDLNQKITGHCDEVLNNAEVGREVEKVLHDRVKYVKAHIGLRIEIIKKKNKIA